MSEERRVHARISVNGEFAEIDGLLSEYVANISRGGMFLRADAELPLGTRVRLSFSVLLDDIETIEGIGEVVHNKKGTQAGLGIRFVELSDESRDIVERVVQAQEKASENA